VLTIASDLGIPVVERAIPREELYITDEVFFVGTATEISPIRSIDRITIGPGERGPITKQLQDEYFAYVKGQADDKYGWRTLVNQPVPAAR
jgi:branched-chain amino acid aminotransferase